MKYIVIGLGNYGCALSRELTALGHEVIGVDNDSQKIEAVKDSIATSFVLDATDEHSLSILPLRAVDVVIVAIGETFGASIKVVALLKKNQVDHIYARALDSVHKAVLEAFNVDQILTPERDAAQSFVRNLDRFINVESLQLDKEYFVIKFKIPTSLVNYRLADLALEREFQLSVVSLLKGEKITNSLGVPVLNKSVDKNLDVDYKLRENDHLVCYGKYKDFLSFLSSI